MRLRVRNPKIDDQPDEDFNLPAHIQNQSHAHVKEVGRKKRSPIDPYGTAQMASDYKHHKADFFEEQRLEKMLDDQNDEDEHDNDIGDDTEQEDDKASVESESEEQKAKNLKKSRYDAPAGKSKNDEPGPLDHAIEFILGDRFPTLAEYHEWLQDEEDRLNPEKKINVVQKGIEVSENDKRKMDQQTKMLINQIVNENNRQIQDEQKKEFENKIVNIDDDDEPSPTKDENADPKKEESKDVEMKEDEKVEDKTEDTKGGENEPHSPAKEEKTSATKEESEKKDTKTEEAVKKEKLKSKFHGQKPSEMQYLIKFKNQSYRKTRWINESSFFDEYSFQCQQKLNRYKIKKKKEIQQGVYVPPVDDEDKYFDRSYQKVCKIISCTNLFPVIHPRQAKNVVNTWREKCVTILQLICNFHQDDHNYGTEFLFLRSDERSLMDFTTINNRLHTIPPAQQQTSNVKNACYNGPIDFWKDISLVFIENMRFNYPGTRKRIYLDTLREMTYHLHRAWCESIQEIYSKESEYKKKMNEEKMKKDAEEAKRAANRLPAEEIMDMFSNLYTNIAKQEVSYNPQFHEHQQVLNSKILSYTNRIREQNPQNCPGMTIAMHQANQQVIANVTQYLAQEQMMTNYATKKQMIDSINQRIRQELRKAGLNIPDPNYDLKSNALKSGGNAASNAIDLDDDDKKDGAQVKEEKPQFIFPGEENFVSKDIDFTWILDTQSHETIDMVLRDDYFDYKDIKDLYLNSKNELDPLYLVKWKNLSYADLTWEPLSTIKNNEKELKDFERFNRSLDNGSRQKMMGFSYAHKQLIKIFQKKLHQGKKIDSRCHEEFQTREMLNKLLKFESKISQGYFQYDFAKNLVPQFRMGQKMKDYQIAGLNWMLRAWQDNRNTVLADEMGLGKTIQSISLLDHLIKICKIRGPFLIIAPLSTLDHWKKIAEEWTLMNTVIYHDQKGAEGRQAIQKEDWYYTDVTNKGTITQKSKLIKFNIMITSYEVFNQDLKEVLVDVPFQYIIVDEAHRLKNKGTKTLVLLKEHPCRKVMLLTGTPIQNNTKELFTLLNYIEPDQFASFERFMEQFGDLKSKEQIDRLHSLLRPHFLRRLKDEVEDSIPPLKETVIDVGLTPIQQQYYKGIYGENLSMLASLGTASLKTAQFCNIDIQLRKCCNHLFLLKGVQDDLEKDCQTDEQYYNKLIEGSGKMKLLDMFVEKYKSDNHKMLIFSQFKGMTDIIKDYLVHKKIRYEILTGTVKSQDRAISIQRFNEDNEFGVFLLTTRAGGLGINLTKARVVVIYDSDWNPQNDLQAIARAHRIGQKFEVEVYRFITAKTYEQHMFDRASKKLGMEQALFQKGAFGHDETMEVADDKKASPEEIENLLRYGAFAFLGQDQDEDEDEDGSKTHMKIEDILANKGKDKKAGKKGHTVHKSSFNVKEDKGGKSSKGKLDVNDKDFWQKTGLKFEGFNAKQLLRKYRGQKNEIIETKESQSKYMKDVSHCVKGILDAKTLDDSRTIDEEIYELLKKISKNKEFESKYRDKATVLLDKVLHFNEYREQLILQEATENGLTGDAVKNLQNGGRRMGRAAKEKVDYTSNGLKKRDGKALAKGGKKNSQNCTQQSVEDGEEEIDPQQEAENQNLIDQIDKDLETENRLKRQRLKEKDDKNFQKMEKKEKSLKNGGKSSSQNPTQAETQKTEMEPGAKKEEENTTVNSGIMDLDAPKSKRESHNSAQSNKRTNSGRSQGDEVKKSKKDRKKKKKKHASQKEEI